VIRYPTWIDLPDGKAIVLDNGTLLRVDLNPGAFCPAEARFPDKANRLLFIALLSPGVLGTIGETTAARRAEWVFELSHQRAIRAMQRLLPLIHDTRRNTR
jgi:hypothetical protein